MKPEAAQHIVGCCIFDE